MRRGSGSPDQEKVLEAVWARLRPPAESVPHWDSVLPVDPGEDLASASLLVSRGVQLPSE